MHISTAKETSQRSHACASIELVEVLTFSIFASGEARGERIGHWQYTWRCTVVFTSLLAYFARIMSDIVVYSVQCRLDYTHVRLSPFRTWMQGYKILFFDLLDLLDLVS